MTIPVNNEIKLLSRNNSGTFFSYALIVFQLVVLVALGTGLLFGIFQSIRINSPNGFIDGIMFGVVAAITIVPILVVLDIIQKIRCYLKYKTIDFEIKQERRFLLDCDYAFAFNKFCEVLSNDKRIEIDKKNMANGTIEATAKRSWRSFGEVIEVRIHKGSTGNVVVLSSKPRIPITMIDYCRNFENIEKIMISTQHFIANKDGDNL